MPSYALAKESLNNHGIAIEMKIHHEIKLLKSTSFPESFAKVVLLNSNLETRAEAFASRHKSEQLLVVVEIFQQFLHYVLEAFVASNQSRISAEIHYKNYNHPLDLKRLEAPFFSSTLFPSVLINQLRMD